MTIGDAAGLALKVHGAVWLSAAAAYYKYGDRTELLDKSLRGNRSARQAIRDRIAGDLRHQLAPIVRDAAHVTSPLLDTSGNYIEQPTDVTEGEPFYQAIRDFVSQSAGALVDYQLVLHATDRWRVWAHRLSRCILMLLALEVVMLAGALLVLLLADITRTAGRWCGPCQRL